MKINTFILTFICLMVTGILSCRHEPIPKPIYKYDTVLIKKRIYVFKDTLSKVPGHKTVYGSSGDTIKDSICFSEQVLPIVISHCAKPGCHDAITVAEGLTYTNYSNIRGAVRPGSPNTGKFMSNILDGSMPPYYSPPALTSAEIKIIQDWISQGAKNNIDCGMGCDTTKFAYTANISPIISSYCVGCHNGSSAGGGYDFSSYSGLVKAVNAGRLLGSINQTTGYSAMPKGGGKLSACEIILVTKWVKAGAPNN